MFEIPPALQTLTQLQWLDLSGAPVRRGWHVLSRLQQLTELRCDARYGEMPNQKHVRKAYTVGLCAMEVSGSWHPATSVEVCGAHLLTVPCSTSPLLHHRQSKLSAEFKLPKRTWPGRSKSWMKRSAGQQTGSTSWRKPEWQRCR